MDEQDFYGHCYGPVDEQEQAALLFVRAFDLGGGGLKTAVYNVSGTCSANVRVRMVPGTMQQCGHAGDNVRWPLRNAGDKRVYQWLRDCISTFSDEKNGGVYSFGASLAELGKLWADKLTREDGSSFQQLIRADEANGGPGVREIGDGHAHLMASKYFLRTQPALFPLCNIALGTGVAINLTNSKGELRSADDMKTICSWNSDLLCPDDGQTRKVFEALGGNFDGGLDSDTQRQARRVVQLINQICSKMHDIGGMTHLATVSLTGAAGLRGGLVELVQAQLPDMVIKRGPVNAGLEGAALLAWKATIGAVA